MFTSSVNLELKSVDDAPTLSSTRAKSSLSKLSLKKAIRSRSKEQENEKAKVKVKVKSLKNVGELSLEATQLSKNNRVLEEQILEAMASLKKLKPISKGLKTKEVDLETIQKDHLRSDEELISLKKKLIYYEEIFHELYHHCKVDDDEGILNLFNSNKTKPKKIRIPRNSLTIEDLLRIPESTKSGNKTARNSNIKSPYIKHSKLLILTGKKMKKSQRSSTRLSSFTPNLKNIEKNEPTDLVIDKKLKKIYKRLKILLNTFNYP